MLDAVKMSNAVKKTFAELLNRMTAGGEGLN